MDSPNAANPAVYEDISPQCIGITDCRSETIRGAVNAATTTIQNVRVQDVLQLGTGVPLFKTTTALTP
jgi:hypothetical protein